jgi:hypothetical protein
MRQVLIVSNSNSECGITEMKFTDNFAKANGYKDIPDLLNKIPEMKEYIIQSFGSIPEWITVDSETNFIGFPLLNTQTKVSFN